LSGGTSDTSTPFSSLFSDILKSMKENSEQIKENMKQIGLLIQIEQARNCRPVLVLGEHETGGTDCQNARCSIFSFTNIIFHTLQAL